MTIHFSKIHGAGNDFILINAISSKIELSEQQISFACHRRYGIGADGLIILKKSDINGCDFSMQYFNSDGKEGTMCGNGGRSITAFAYLSGFKKSKFSFNAIDGIHESEIISNNTSSDFDIKLKMTPVLSINQLEDGLFLDTGSPHFVVFVDDAKKADVVGMGKMLRHDPRFAPGGTNVDFVSYAKGRLMVRTFERGVEDETLSCGTGITASAIATAKILELPFSTLDVDALGGSFQVSFQENKSEFHEIWLRGPVKFVFHGTIEL